MEKLKHNLPTFRFVGHEQVFVQAEDAYRQIEAERERCAKIIDEVIDDVKRQSPRLRLNSVDQHVTNICQRIAGKIRSGDAS